MKLLLVSLPWIRATACQMTRYVPLILSLSRRGSKHTSSARLFISFYPKPWCDCVHVRTLSRACLCVNVCSGSQKEAVLILCHAIWAQSFYIGSVVFLWITLNIPLCECEIIYRQLTSEGKKVEQPCKKVGLVFWIILIIDHISTCIWKLSIPSKWTFLRQYIIMYYILQKLLFFTVVLMRIQTKRKYKTVFDKVSGLSNELKYFLIFYSFAVYKQLCYNTQVLLVILSSANLVHFLKLVQTKYNIISDQFRRQI